MKLSLKYLRESISNNVRKKLPMSLEAKQELVSHVGI
jgi:hypothetical protein